jgi:hypothetical protein
MIHKNIVIFISSTLLASNTLAATLYLCKNYSGGSFWASNPCSEHRALIERMVTVPDNMPFAQQVEIGNQVQANAQNLATQQLKPSISTNAQEPTVNCSAISKEIAALDAMARQPQSAGTQDWIASQRKTLRDTQFRNRCR